jgi:hypothetical protein
MAIPQIWLVLFSSVSWASKCNPCNLEGTNSYSSFLSPLSESLSGNLWCFSDAFWSLYWRYAQRPKKVEHMVNMAVREKALTCKKRLHVVIAGLVLLDWVCFLPTLVTFKFDHLLKARHAPKVRLLEGFPNSDCSIRFSMN